MSRALPARMDVALGTQALEGNVPGLPAPSTQQAAGPGGHSVGKVLLGVGIFAICQGGSGLGSGSSLEFVHHVPFLWARCSVDLALAGQAQLSLETRDVLVASEM